MFRKVVFIFMLSFMFLYGCGSNGGLLDNNTVSSSEDIETPVINYTVTYNGNGGSGYMSPSTFTGGEKKALSLNKFILSGYSFTGWGLSSNGQPVYEDGAVISVSDNITLYALWMKNDSSSGGSTGSEEGGDTGGSTEVPSSKLMIKFNANNGDGYIPPLEFNAGENVVLSQNIFIRAGYEFSGWSTKSNGNVEYSDMATVNFNDNVTLYAVWKEMPKYTITYNSNNIISESRTSEVYASSEGNKLEANTFVNGTLKFIGWSTSSNSNKAEYQDEEIIYGLNRNLTLYAVWSSSALTVSFDANGGTGTMNSLYVNKGDTVTLPTPTFYKDGYKFKGAYIIKDTIEMYSAGSDYTVESDVTFVTQWVRLNDEETIIFGGNSDTFKNVEKWVDGVVVNEEDWVPAEAGGIYYAVRKEGSGWYDTYQDWLNLCWAGTSSNVLHWWFDRNKDNVEKYYASYAPDGAERPKTGYDWGQSDIFSYFYHNWPNEGYFVYKALEWYLVGLETKGNGAFFKDVLGDVENIVDTYGFVTQYNFNQALDKAFKQGMGIGATEINLFGLHAITIWGAHFDENGFVDKIYVTDSASPVGNNSTDGSETGLQGLDVVYDDVTGKVYYKTYLGGKIQLISLYLLSQFKDEWQNYFDTHKPLR